jgi:hypothetical protein
MLKAKKGRKVRLLMPVSKIVTAKEKFFNEIIISATVNK